MGSQTLITASDYKSLYVASAAENTITRVSADLSENTRLRIEGEPTRLARVGDRIWATLRAQRAIAIIHDTGTELVVERSLDTGAEPVGIVAREDGRFVYVASSQSGRVDEIDPQTMTMTRSWDIPNQPTWLALHPSGNSLYVASAREGMLSRIDLRSGVSQVVDLPKTEAGSSRRPVTLTNRLTGDPTVSPSGQLLAVPVLVVNDVDEVDPPDDAPGRPSLGGGYNERMNPMVALVEIDKNGVPVDDAITERVPVGNIVFREGKSGYISSTTFSPDSALVIAAIEGAAQLVVFPVEGSDEFLAEPKLFRPGNRFVDTGGRLRYEITGPDGPRGVAFTDDNQGFVYGFLDRVVSKFSLEEIRQSVDDEWKNGELFAYSGVEVAASTLDPSVERGRRLFYTTTDSRMSEGGVSCATCHFEGRDDGATWNFARGPRQTPSLAGQISALEPVRWDGLMDTVADDVLGTAGGLMGGEGLTHEAANDVAAFIDYIRAVDVPATSASDTLVAEGRAIFERSDTGCANCHAGSLYTDLQIYDLPGFVGVKTPSLLGVSATPPYLHDGSAATLEDLLNGLRSGQKGSTANLNEQEMSALAAYLRSL